MTTEKRPNRFQFIPSLSIDGVAIICGIIMAALWFGQLKQKVDSTADTVAEHQKELRELNKTTASIAVLLNDLNERERMRQKNP